MRFYFAATPALLCLACPGTPKPDDTGKHTGEETGEETATETGEETGEETGDHTGDTGDTGDTGEPEPVSPCFVQSTLTATQLLDLPGANIVGATTDDSGNLYLADQAGARIIEVDASGQVNELVTGVNELGQGISELELVGNNLYFSEANTGAIFKIDLAGTFPVAYSSLTAFIQDNFNDPGGLTSDSSGNLYISSVESGTDPGYISKIDPSGTLLELSWASLDGSWPTLTVDEADNIYTVETNGITQITPAQMSASVISNIHGPVGLTYQDGCLYFTDDDGVKQFDFSTNPPFQIFDHTAVGVVIPEPTRILVDGLQQITYLSTTTLWRLQ
jgi:hypothetical protein